MILTKEKWRGSTFVFRQSVRQNCRIWYSGIFLCVMTLVKTSGGLAFSSITADSLHPPQGCRCTVASQQGAQNSILQLGKQPSKGGILKINQPRWGMMMRDRVLSTWTGWLHDESQWLCLYNSIVEGGKQNKSGWRIHNSQVFSVATSPRCRVYENTHKHTHTCTRTLVSSGYRESWILMNSGQLLHSLLPVQLPLTCQSKHLLRTHSLKFSYTLEEWLSPWPHAEFPQPNHLIQNSWRARSQEYKSRSRDRTRSD